MRVNRRALLALTRYLLQRAARLDPGHTCGEFSLVLMDDDRISELNAAHLGHRYSTDVLSFRYDPMPGEDAQYVGEVVINVAMAARKGMRAGWSPEREVALYIAHGCDHLSGATDEDVAQRRRMRRRELRWLRGASDAGLTGGILKGTD